MPMSAIRSKNGRGEAGFTLVEMLAVLVILALALGTASAVFMRGPGRMSADAVAAETASLARAARDMAVRSGRSTSLRLDLARRTIVIEGSGRRVVVPSAMDIEITAGITDRRGGGAAGVQFFPDGSSTGATIRIGQPRSFHEVRINWFTGRVLVVPPV
jgi:general secretion pathway protein H